MNFQIQDECIYWHLVGMVTDTVSSGTYLDHYGILKTNISAQVDPETYTIRPDADWWTFQKKFNTLSKNRKKLLEEYPPGLYVQDFGENIGVHFYGLDDQGIMVNGYPDTAGFSNAIGLGFQEDHSHGFCQTYAIMHILGIDIGLESRDSKDDDRHEVYMRNGHKALDFLKDFTRDHPWGWENSEEFEDQLPEINCEYDKDEMKSLLKALVNKEKPKKKGKKTKKDKTIYLTDIVQVIVNNSDHFENWFK